MQTEEGLKKVAEFIREHIKNRNGILNENRCDYFKGASCKSMEQGAAW